MRGTRITVGEVLGALASGLSESEVIVEFPQLTHEDLLACFAFEQPDMTARPPRPTR